MSSVLLMFSCSETKGETLRVEQDSALENTCAKTKLDNACTKTQRIECKIVKENQLHSTNPYSSDTSVFFYVNLRLVLYSFLDEETSQMTTKSISLTYKQLDGVLDRQISEQISRN